MLDNYKDILTVEDLMEIFEVGRNAAYELLHTNTIKHIKIGHIYRIPKIYVLDYICNS